MSQRLSIGVLASGSGTNLQALIDASAADDYPAKVAVVISNNAAARALQRAEQARISTVLLDAVGFPTRDQFENALLERLEAFQVKLLCLAGFMRILSPRVLKAFPGLHATRQALAHGVKISGCTVHFVDAGTDTGPIIVQAAVPVLPGDDEASLAARIQKEEHRIFPLAVRWVAEGLVSLQGRVVQFRGEPGMSDQALRNPGRRLP